MKALNQMVIIGFLLLCAAPVHAATITAFAEVISTSVTDTLSPPAQTSGSIDIEATNGAGSITADAEIDVSGNLYVKTQGSYVGGVGDSSWDSTATVTWSESFTNSTGTDQVWAFNYLVLAGSLEMSMMPGAGATGTFELNISLDSTSLKAASVTLTPGSYLETGAGFGGTFATPTVGETTYTWDQFTDSLLFTVAAFSTSTLTYTMQATESVNITDAVLECPDDAFVVDDCSTGFIGGDPFDATSVIVSITPVPVPAGIWLLGSALGLLGWMRRKSR
ncbi:MAG: VPLPA-CTERM sorting domain-containing protein [Gammaproteobacteria bacterium]|nr:VPLPA-CTERM sorting domain-containing protein [Gammaproteobacteria bacterium]